MKLEEKFYIYISIWIMISEIKWFSKEFIFWFFKNNNKYKVFEIVVMYIYFVLLEFGKNEFYVDLSV